MTFSDGVDYTLALALFAFHPVEDHSPLESNTVVLAVAEEADAVAFVPVAVDSIPVAVVEHAVAVGMAVVGAGMVAVVDWVVGARVAVADEHQDEQIVAAEHQVAVSAIQEVDHLLEGVDVVFEGRNELVGPVADAGRLGPVEVNMAHLVSE
jgi:hypothetical protein